MREFFQPFLREFSSLVFPARCLKCGAYIKSRGDASLSGCFCSPCTGFKLPRFQSPYCPCCGQGFESGDVHLCEACLKKRPVIHSVRAAFRYEGIIREAVGLFKYRSRLSLAKPFETRLFQAFAEFFDQEPVDLILPIPLHPAKARKRGFNQSFLLVRNFESIYQRRYGQPPPWQVDISGLSRVKMTPSQTGLDHRQREKNLRDAFQWQGGTGIKGKEVLLVDDVYTTGATCLAAAATLMKAGADRVSALVLARA